VRIDCHRVDRGVVEVPVVVGKREDEAAPGGVDVEQGVDRRRDFAQFRDGVDAAVLGRPRDADHQRRVVVDARADGLEVGPMALIGRDESQFDAEQVGGLLETEVTRLGHDHVRRAALGPLAGDPDRLNVRLRAAKQ